MYSRIKESLKERLYNTKELEIKKILNEGIYHLLYNTSKEVNDVEISISKMVIDLKKLLL